MKHITQLTAIACIVVATSAFVAADSPSRPQTPVTPELIDLSAYAEWVDGVERSLDTQRPGRFAAEFRFVLVPQCCTVTDMPEITHTSPTRERG